MMAQLGSCMHRFATVSLRQASSACTNLFHQSTISFRNTFRGSSSDGSRHVECGQHSPVTTMSQDDATWKRQQDEMCNFSGLMGRGEKEAVDSGMEAGGEVGYEALPVFAPNSCTARITMSVHTLEVEPSPHRHSNCTSSRVDDDSS